MMKANTTAQRLKQIMSMKDLRQVDVLRIAEPFCKKYGVRLGKNDLSQYLSGKVEPKQDKLTVLGLALGVSEAWLMGFDVPMERDAVQTNVAPDSEHKISENDLKAAFFNGADPSLTQEEIDAMWEDAQEYFRFKIEQRRSRQKQ